MDERFGLTAQMRRAALSVSSNIAEGSSRSSDQDFAQFVEIAYGSLVGVVSQVAAANKPGFLSDSAHKGLYDRADELARMLSGFRGTL